jgi:hypothetical protein
MFGMEKQKKKGKDVFLFDLEKELQDPEKSKGYAKRIQDKINKIKEFLRKGSRKEEFDQLGILLNGYHALAICLGRAAAAKQKPK